MINTRSAFQGSVIIFGWVLLCSSCRYILFCRKSCWLTYLWMVLSCQLGLHCIWHYQYVFACYNCVHHDFHIRWCSCCSIVNRRVSLVDQWPLFSWVRDAMSYVFLCSVGGLLSLAILSFHLSIVCSTYYDLLAS